jgi:hypothetical protein
MNSNNYNGLRCFKVRPEYLLMIILSPLLSSFLLAGNYSKKEVRPWLYFIFVLFGLTIVISSINIDAYREIKLFQLWAQSSYQDFIDTYNSLYSDKSNVDLFQPFVMFIISRVTASPMIYFGFIALTYAIFQLNVLSNIYDNLYSRNVNSWIHLCFFIMILPVFYINGSRWALAAWIYFYGVYFYFKSEKSRYLLWVFTSVLVHFSFLGPIGILLLFIIVGKRNIVYYCLIILSFIISPYAVTVFQGANVGDFTGLQDRVLTYANNDTILYRTNVFAQSAWFIRIQADLVWYYVFGSVIILNYKYRIKNEFADKVYSLTLLLFAFANTLRWIPSGSRFSTIFLLFGTLYLIIVFSFIKIEKVHILTFLGLLPIVLWILIEVRKGIEILNIYLLIPLPFAFIYSSPVNDLFKFY